MLQIGCHLSSVKGFEHMGEEALSIGANTFQFFTRNPRGGKAKDIDPEDVKRFLELADEHRFAKLVAHAPYTLNPCSATEKVRDFALFAMEDDMKRMEYVPGNYYNFHPGSHVGQGSREGNRADLRAAQQDHSPKSRARSFCWKPCREKAAKWEAGLKSCVLSSTAWSRRIRSASAWIRVM